MISFAVKPKEAAIHQSRHIVGTGCKLEQF